MASVCVFLAAEYQDPLHLQFNNLRRNEVRGISYDSQLKLMFNVFALQQVCLCTKEKTRKKGNERQSEREQVLEWLMADSMNSHHCSFLIKGMNLSFVSPVNNENPAALKHPPSGLLHIRLNI